MFSGEFYTMDGPMIRFFVTFHGTRGVRTGPSRFQSAPLHGYSVGLYAPRNKLGHGNSQRMKSLSFADVILRPSRSSVVTVTPAAMASSSSSDDDDASQGPEEEGDQRALGGALVVENDSGSPSSTSAVHWTCDLCLRILLVIITYY